MFTRRFFILLTIAIVLAVLGAIWHPMLIVSYILTGALAVATIVDMLASYVATRLLTAKREHADAFSLSQPNKVTLTVTSHLPERLSRLFRYDIFDTPPEDWAEGTVAEADLDTATKIIKYYYTPVSRGRHEFGVVRCFVTMGFLRLFECRRFFNEPTVVKVYPTFRNLDSFEVRVSMNDPQHGSHRIRRAGNNTEFEQIRAYVPGDDKRTINWRATARATSLMVNSYTDERAKPIVPVVCSGPSMLITTESGVSLLDRACSAAIALASSALRRYDEVGLITLSHTGVNTYFEAERSASTVSKLLRATYDFGLPPTPSERHLVDDPDVSPSDDEEVDQKQLDSLLQRVESLEADPDYDALAAFVTTRISRRSMIMLYANFENIEVARLAIPALRRIAARHTLVVVLFENDSINDVAREPYHGTPSHKLSEQRFRAMCADYIEQKHRLAAYLRSRHINVLITTPDNLSDATVRTYLQLKSRAVI